jgi:hypothetical protein
VRKDHKYASTSGAGGISRGSSGKTSAVAFYAVEPQRLEVLKAASNAFLAAEMILAALGGSWVAASLQNRLYAHQCQATSPLLVDRGSNLLPTLPPPPQDRVEGANGPTNARAGGICPVEQRRGLHPQSSARSIVEKGDLLSPARIILTSHPFSSPRPMMPPVLAGTLSIVDLQRRSTS